MSIRRRTPLKPGRAGTMTHDYTRNGTTTLLAALNVLAGTVVGRCMQRHRHQEFVRFLNGIDAAVPVGRQKPLKRHRITTFCVYHKWGLHFGLCVCYPLKLLYKHKTSKSGKIKICCRRRQGSEDMYNGLGGRSALSAQVNHFLYDNYSAIGRTFINVRSADALAKEHFLKELQREKRRAERSQSPLSLAIFHCEGNSREMPTGTWQLLKLIYETKRTIDVVGKIDQDAIGVLLVETSAEGAQGFLQRVKARSQGLSFNTTVSTYPDNIFDRLLKDKQAETLDLPESFLLEQERAGRAGQVIKRIFDFFFALIALVAFMPVMAGTALVIAATSPGPVLFRQTRLGRNGVSFVMNKFRSMYHNADDRLHREHVTQLIRGDKGEGGSSNAKRAWNKLENDPRITPVGRIIRSLKIDELPQLVNVLMGDLSLVGPRPPLPYEVAQYETWHLRRLLSVRPGITGMWQIRGGNTTFDEMVRLDLQYIDDWSLFLDLKILLKTGLVIVRRIANFGSDCDSSS